MIKTFETVKFVVEIVISVLLTILIYQNERKGGKTSKTMSCLTELFSHYKDTMKKINQALEESKELEQYLKDCSQKNEFKDFNDVYYSPKYDTFRDVHYFFELLGSLTREDEIDQFTVWHYFSFPIDYFLKTKNIRYLITLHNCLPSYGENFCCLFLFYNDRRVKNGIPWIANGEDFILSVEQAIELSGGYQFKKEEKRKYRFR